jgi:predicted dehydrogenase
MNKPLKYGIIGFGRYAINRLYPAFLKSQYSALVAISKRDINQAQEIASKLNIPKYFSEPEYLLQESDIDAAIIASPPAYHMEHTLLAAKHGKQVMVEKPFAVNQKQAETMIKVCKQNNVKLMAAFVMRFIEAIQVAREWILSGKLGELKYIGGYFGIDSSLSNRLWLDDPVVSGGGVVADLGSHFIDLITFLSGLKIHILDVTLEPLPSKISVEKNALISFSLGKKSLGSLYLSFEVIRESGLTFHGSKGKFTLQNFNQPETTVYLTQRDTKGEVIVPVKNGNYYAKMIDHFSQSILNNQQILTPGETGLENQKLLDIIYSKISK